MPILGLTTTESDANWRFTNIRRQVFYSFPNGAAPLTGLLALMEEESTDDPKFSWYEDRYEEVKTTTASQGGAIGPLQTNAGADLGDPGTLVLGTSYRLFVAALDSLKVNDVIKAELDIDTTDVSTGGTTALRGLISAKQNPTGAGYVTIVALTAHSANKKNRPKNGAGGSGENVGKEVLVVGTSFEQGAAGPTSEQYSLPIQPENYCQIHRTPFSMTGTALKTGLKFDESGGYKHKAKKHSLDHMTGIERSALFGGRYTTGTGPGGLPLYTSGGLLWYLEQWEMAAGEASIQYRGSSATAITADTDDNKRIIENATGVMTEKLYDTLLERVFRVSNNTTNEKLALCGSGALLIMNQLYRSKGVLNSNLPMTDTYGMDVVAHRTPFGTVYYKTHPLFSKNDLLRYAILIVDIHNMKYRFVDGRDTELLKNRQNNGDDFRRDEWLTECGNEVRFPEAHMLIKNIREYAG